MQVAPQPESLRQATTPLATALHTVQVLEPQLPGGHCVSHAFPLHVKGAHIWVCPPEQFPELSHRAASVWMPAVHD